jgi:hypothetical protein
VFGFEIHPILIQLSSSLNQGLSIHFTFALHASCSKFEHSWHNDLLPWSPNMSRNMTIFAYFCVKPMFVIQMSMKQPFNCIIINASIDFALTL